MRIGDIAAGRKDLHQSAFVLSIVKNTMMKRNLACTARIQKTELEGLWAVLHEEMTEDITLLNPWRPTVIS